MSKLKLQNVAEEAKVSLTTAFLALSDHEAPRIMTVLVPMDERWAHVFSFIRPIIEEIERSLIREGYYPLVLPTFHSSEAENIVGKILANGAMAVFSIHYGNEALFGFRKAMEEFGIPFGAEQRLSARLEDPEGLAAGLRALFSRQRKPTALFIHDDYFAARVIAELAVMGLRVPENVSIIAPGDVLNYSEPHVPRITTMRINTALMGQISADLIVNRLKRNPEDIHVLKVKQQPVDRGSCRRIG